MTSDELDYLLEDVETNDLVDYLRKDRGVDIPEEGDEPELSGVSTEMLRIELDARGEAGGDFADAMSRPHVAAWLRDANPPQEVRDAFYETFGRMLL